MAQSAIWLDELSQWAAELPEDIPLWVGYSGGLDSTVLLHWLSQQSSLSSRVRALHVHHGLSPNADAWVAHCQTQCANWHIPLTVEKVLVQQQGDGIEQAARQARYDAFERRLADQDILLLAHHGDDQIETFLQRWRRGAGLAGLRSMLPQRFLCEGRHNLVIRPLLGVWRHQLHEYAKQHGLSWVDDESNVDARYERNWWRHQVVAAMHQQFGSGMRSALRTISQLGQDQQLLEELLAGHVDDVVVAVRWPATGVWALSLEALENKPMHYWPYLIRAWLARCGLMMPSQDWLDRLQQEVMCAGEDKQPKLALQGGFVRRFKKHLYWVAYEPKPQAMKVSQSLVRWDQDDLQVDISQISFTLNNVFVVAAGEVVQQKVALARRPSKTFKQLLQQTGIPPWLRSGWPVLMIDKQVIAIVGMGAVEPFSPEIVRAQRWCLE